MNKQKRLVGIDIFRGWAIILMISFHISYDLQYFHIVDFHIQSNEFFRWFRFLIVTMFLLTVGMSLKLAHKNQINWFKFRKRAIYLGLSSLIVSISSYFLFPHSWIYFGILHFILLSSFIVIPLLNYPYMALIVAVTTFVAFQLDMLNMHWLFDLVATSLHLPPRISVDIVRLFPWLSFVLVGVAIVSLNLHTKIFDNSLFNSKNRINNLFQFMGRHALAIYLVHQPLLFGVFFLVKV